MGLYGVVLAPARQLIDAHGLVNAPARQLITARGTASMGGCCAALGEGDNTLQVQAPVLQPTSALLRRKRDQEESDDKEAGL